MGDADTGTASGDMAICVSLGLLSAILIFMITVVLPHSAAVEKANALKVESSTLQTVKKVLNCHKNGKTNG